MIIPDNILDHLSKVWAGEYNIGLECDNQDFKVLDLGANVGTFALWAMFRWKGSAVTCYEPVPENFSLLEQNLAHLQKRVDLHNAAVLDTVTVMPFFLGKHNCGEGSIFHTVEQSDEAINVIVEDAANIAYHDIVKIDTEGAEVIILQNLQFKPFGYMIEYHSTENRIQIDRELQDYYTLVEHKSYMLGKGLVKYIRNDLLAK